MAEDEVRRELRVPNEQGLHARPAALLVKLANTFQSRIELIKDDTRVDAKSILQVMTLAAVQGTVLALEVRGADARSAADAIEKMFQELIVTDADDSTSEPEPTPG
jgi:phosphocarrier protein